MKLFDFKKSQDFKDDEHGAGTVFAIFMAVTCIGAAGLAIDAANAWSAKQRLQSSTDIAAHAAALEMIWPNDRVDATPAAAAIAALVVNMPPSRYGVALDAQDVVLGNWNPATHQITNDSTDASGNPLNQAVQVTARLDGNVGDLVPTFLLKLLGFDNWAISTRAVFIRDVPGCANDGFLAAGIVNFASNSDILNRFCVHGNQGVDFNDNIVFGTGVRITMPNKAPFDEGGMLNLRGGNYTWADGKDNQIGEQYLDPYLTSLPRITGMIQDLSDPSDPNQPIYIDDFTVYPDIVVTPANPLNIAAMHTGAVNVIDCPNRGLDLPAGAILRNMVIIADCKVSFGDGVVLEDVTFATTNASNHAFSASSGLTLGLDDHCADGGGVTLIAPGDVNLAAQVEWYGVEVIAHGDVHISAISDGIEGVSIQAGGDIFATSNLNFGLCSGGIDHYREHYMVRMVY